MWDVHFLAAFAISASDQHLRAMFLPAPFHGIESVDMIRQDMFLVSLQETILELADDGGEQNHLTPPHLMSTFIVTSFG
jgi:hypothetical protein